MPSAIIQRHNIMAFLCMSTYAAGTKLRFRWVNAKYQKTMSETTHKECHTVSDLALCYWYPLVFEDNTQVVFDFPISLTLHQIDGAANKQALFVE